MPSFDLRTLRHYDYILVRMRAAEIGPPAPNDRTYAAREETQNHSHQMGEAHATSEVH